MKNIILLFLILFSCKIYAQTDFRKGEIIKLNGDTIRGELNFQEDTENSKEIRFRNQDYDSVFRPFEIKSYSFEKGKYYISKIAVVAKDTSMIFAEYLVRGKKDLFYHRSASGFHYSLSVSDTVIKEIPFKIELINLDGINYQKESKLHIGYLKVYFNDCPSIFPAIEQLKSLERKSLIALTKKYHDINCGEGSCIIYEKKKYPVKIAFEPTFSYSLKKAFSHEGPMYSYGGNLYLWIPGSSERLYIKTGLNYTKLRTSDYIQIPIQFEYVYPFKVIKPKFDIGLNMHFLSDEGQGLTTLVSSGCLIRLTDRIYLDFDISTDLFAFSYETGVFLTFVARTGIYININ
ncbi:MAG: hypothetical protein HOO86_10735 [Bacteroidales bacterium]|nr:hypothetical protein [Bacteroidales bacterium]